MLGEELRIGGVAQFLPGDEGPRPVQRGALRVAVHGPGDGGAVAAGSGELVKEDVLKP